MQSGNGIDLAAVYQLLTEVAQTVRGQEARLTGVEHKLNELVVAVNAHSRTLDELAVVANAHAGKIDDVAAGLGELRRAVHQYHDAVIGHGVELTRVEERVKRIEEHLRLDPLAI